MVIITLMILYNTDILLDLPRFGIQIPALDSRKIRTLEELKSCADLKTRQSEWLVDGFDDNFGPDDLHLAHSKEYVGGFFDQRVDERIQTAFELISSGTSDGWWKPETALSPLRDMVPRLLKFMAGAYRAGRIALDSGFCHFLGGGTHHGHRDFGHGFCPFNDSALAIFKLLAEERIERAWVIDLDAHKGDGTASLFADDPRVMTLSIHMAQGWPLDGSLPSGHPSYTPSTIDIPIESGEEGIYLQRLEEGLATLKRRAPADLAIVVAGADPWEGDALASSSLLQLDLDQLFQRDRLVYDFLDAEGIPSAWLTAGGYGADSWQIHYRFLSWAIRRRLGPG